VQNFVSQKFCNENPARIAAIEKLIGDETRRGTPPSRAKRRECCRRKLETRFDLKCLG